MHHRNLDTDDSSVEQDDQVPVVHDSHDSQSSGQPNILDTRILLRPNILRCYTVLSVCFTRLRQLMTGASRQHGRCFAVLYQLQQVFVSFEENRPNARNYSLLHQMMASITDSEAVARFQSPNMNDIESVDAVEERLLNDPSLQPEEEIATDEERAEAPVFPGGLPSADEHGSPENMAGWMIKRLSRRIWNACINGYSAFATILWFERNYVDVLSLTYPCFVTTFP